MASESDKRVSDLQAQLKAATDKGSANSHIFLSTCFRRPHTHTEISQNNKLPKIPEAFKCEFVKYLSL